MNYRKLRIAWSILWGVVCLLLVVLWVRSYGRTDALIYQIGNGRAWSTMFSQGRFVYVFSDIPSNVGLAGFDVASWTTGKLFIDMPDEPALNGKWGFFGRIDPTFFRRVVVVVPIWILTLSSVLLGAAPWLRWRFSLRTLLIATTLFAVGLGCAVYIQRQ